MAYKLRAQPVLRAEIETTNVPYGLLAIWSLGQAGFVLKNSAREGANKQVISSQADSLIKISRIWADFFPVNTSNQPI